MNLEVNMSLDITLYNPVHCPTCGETVGREEVGEFNVTHNLGKMAQRAHVYSFLWRAPEVGVERAEQLIKPLEHALEEMARYPEIFYSLQPENGWGTLTGFTEFCTNLLEACKKHPDAEVHISR